MVSNAKTPWILLAGGKSSRMGYPKGLQDFQGVSWLEFQLIQFKKSEQRRGVLVLGYRHEEYQEALPWLSRALKEGGILHQGIHLQVVINPMPEYGPFSSIQTGARTLLNENALTTSIAVLPIDVPCPRDEVWQALNRVQKSAVIPTFQGQGGHPVKLSRSFVEVLLRCPPDSSASRLDFQIQLLPESEVERVATHDASVLMNFNTPLDWKTMEASPLRNELVR